MTGGNGNGSFGRLLSERTGVSMGLVITLILGVATTIGMLLSQSDRFVTKEYFEARMTAIDRQFDIMRSDIRGDLAELKLDLLNRLWNESHKGEGDAPK